VPVSQDTKVPSVMLPHVYRPVSMEEYVQVQTLVLARRDGSTQIVPLRCASILVAMGEIVHHQIIAPAHWNGWDVIAGFLFVNKSVIMEACALLPTPANVLQIGVVSIVLNPSVIRVTSKHSLRVLAG